MNQTMTNIKEKCYGGLRRTNASLLSGSEDPRARVELSMLKHLRVDRQVAVALEETQRRDGLFQSLLVDGEEVEGQSKHGKSEKERPGVAGVREVNQRTRAALLTMLRTRAESGSLLR
jgi:hypothetical protein